MKNPELFKEVKDKEGNIVDIKLDVYKNAVLKAMKGKNKSKELFEAAVEKIKDVQSLQMMSKLSEILGHLKDRKTPELKEL